MLAMPAMPDARDKNPKQNKNTKKHPNKTKTFF
jgi:hypothetical protein